MWRYLKLRFKPDPVSEPTPVLSFFLFLIAHLVLDFLMFLVVRATAAKVMPNGENDQKCKQGTCDFDDVLFSFNRGFDTVIKGCFKVLPCQSKQ